MVVVVVVVVEVVMVKGGDGGGDNDGEVVSRVLAYKACSLFRRYQYSC